MAAASSLAGPILARPVFFLFFFFEKKCDVIVAINKEKSINKEKLGLMHNSGLINHQHGSQRATTAYVKYVSSFSHLLQLSLLSRLHYFFTSDIHVASPVSHKLYLYINVVDLPTKPYHPQRIQQLAVQCKAQRYCESQSRQLKNEGEKIFPRTSLHCLCQ